MTSTRDCREPEGRRWQLADGTNNRGPKWLWDGKDDGRTEPTASNFCGTYYPAKPTGPPPIAGASARRRIEDDSRAEVWEQKDRIRALTARARAERGRPVALSPPRRPGIDRDGNPRTASKDPDTKAWTLRPRTKLEEQEFAAAKAKAKANIAKVQKVWGKVFEGQAFIADPAEVLFENFEVRQEMVRTVKLTNVSRSFNSFKLLDDDGGNGWRHVADFFEITYERPGRMSAGKSCELTIRFTPKLNEDIHTAIPFMAETGKFPLALRATTKKVDIHVSPRELHFGAVQFAKAATRHVVVENRGALAARFDVRGTAITQAVALDEADGKAVRGRPLSIKPKKTDGIYIAGGGRVELALAFAPMRHADRLGPKLQAGDTNDHWEDDAEGVAQPLRLDLRFSAHRAGAADFFVDLHGRGVDVPVYVAQDCRVIDMRCCYFGTLYREELVLYNRGKTSMRVQPEIPPPLRPYLDFVPKFGFIQPPDSRAAEVQAGVKFDDVKVGMAVTMTPTGCMPGRDRYQGTCLDKRVGNPIPILYPDRILVRWSDPDKGGPPPSRKVREVTEELREWWDGAGAPTTVQVGGRRRGPDGKLYTRTEWDHAWWSAHTDQQWETADKAGDPKLVFQMKFRPQPSIVKECGKYLKSMAADGQRLTARLDVTIPDQALPVSWELRCDLTTPLLQIAPLRDGRPRLDFGPCSVDEAASLPLDVTNPGMLAMTVGFGGSGSGNLPRELSVAARSPGDTPGALLRRILPRCTETFDVVFRPDSVAPFRQEICLKTERNDEYRVLVTGRGVEAPLRLSESVVSLPATAVGDVSSATLILHNRSRQVQVFEFDVPGHAPGRGGLSVSPTCGEVAPGGTEPILVEFVCTALAVGYEPPRPASPPPSAEPEERAESPPPAGAPPRKGSPEKGARGPPALDVAGAEDAGGSNTSGVMSSGPGEAWSRHPVKQLQCWVKGVEQPLCLEVRQCAVLPGLVAVDPDLAREAAEAARAAAGEPEDAKAAAKPGGKAAGKPKTPEVGKKPAPKGKKGGPAAEQPPTPPPEKKEEEQDRPPPDPLRCPDEFLAWHAANAVKEMNFRSLPALQPRQKTILLRNVSQHPTRLSVRPLDPFGPFTVLKPPAALLRPGHVSEVVVQFRATSAAVYRDELVITGAGSNQIIVPMRGTGLTPKLTAQLAAPAFKQDKLRPVLVEGPFPKPAELDGVEALEAVESVRARLQAAAPHDAGLALSFGGREMRDGELVQDAVRQWTAPVAPLGSTPITLRLAPAQGRRDDRHTQILACCMGSMLALETARRYPQNYATVAGEIRRRTLTFTNQSRFPVRFSIEFDPETTEPLNNGGSVPFACTPNRGLIPAEQTQEVVCQFQADHAFEHYRAEAVCEYGGAGCSIRLRFSGSAWSTGTYVRLPGALKMSDPVSVGAGSLAPQELLTDDISSLFAIQPVPPVLDPKLPALGQGYWAVLEFTPTFEADGRLVNLVHQAVYLGNIGKGDGKPPLPPAAEASVELVDPRKSFELSPQNPAPSKIPLPLGEEKAVIVTFRPENAAELRESELPVEGVGITVEAELRITLRGGFPPPPGGQAVYTVLLKGNVRIPAAR